VRPKAKELRSATEIIHTGSRPSKRARLDPIPEDASVSDGHLADGGRWRMDSDFEAMGEELPDRNAPAPPGSGAPSNAWKTVQLTARPPRLARKDLRVPSVSGKSKKKSVFDKAKDALRRR
jgi:hypothetical protein